eukprot:gene20180-26917_t
MIEADKSKEELASRVKAHQEAVTKLQQLDKRMAILTAELANREERLRVKTAEAGGLSKQLQLMGINNKEMQKQLAALTTEKGALQTSLEEARGQLSQRTSQMQTAQVQAVCSDKERAMAESTVREQYAAERAKLISAADESKREAVVQKTLAEGWLRDIKVLNTRLKSEQDTISQFRSDLETVSKAEDKKKYDIFMELNTRLKSEQDTISQLRSDLETVSKAEDNKKYDIFMAGTLAETVNKDLKQQLEKKDVELKRLRADSLSAQRRLEKVGACHTSAVCLACADSLSVKKRLEKQVESLQRECNESALEVQRLRRGDGLPMLPMAHQPRSLNDDLSHLKRLVASMPGPEGLRDKGDRDWGTDGGYGGSGGGARGPLKLPSTVRSQNGSRGSVGSGNGVIAPTLGPRAGSK